ncbi:MAG: hypothetical protein ACYC55_06605 [Candidatus Geothermincolia bacterium]
MVEQARPQADRTGAYSILGWLGILAVLAIPFAISAYRFGDIFDYGQDTLLLLARFAGLTAACFVFLGIVTGSFRPLLAKRYPPALLHRAHIIFGLSGLAFALSHLTLLIPVLAIRWKGSSKIWFLAGPAAAALLLITVSTALASRRFRGSWRLLHLSNYLILGLAVGHGVSVGADGRLLALRIIFAAFGMVALAGLVYRATTPAWRALFKARRSA